MKKNLINIIAIVLLIGVVVFGILAFFKDKNTNEEKEKINDVVVKDATTTYGNNIHIPSVTVSEKYIYNENNNDEIKSSIENKINDIKNTIGKEPNVSYEFRIDENENILIILVQYIEESYTYYSNYCFDLMHGHMMNNEEAIQRLSLEHKLFEDGLRKVEEENGDVEAYMNTYFDTPKDYSNAFITFYSNEYNVEFNK